jgi:hypothetical protein
MDGEVKEIVGNNLPCILAETEGEFVMLVTSDALDRCGGRVPDLKGKIYYYAEIRDLEIP